MENALEKLRKVYIKLLANPYAILFIGLFILLVPYFFRGFVMHGQESYFYSRISNFILENNIPNYDFLSFGGRAFFYSIGAHLSIVLINLILGISVTNILVFLPIILGISSLMLFYFILKKFNLSRNVISFACYIFLLSPAFLYSYAHFTSFTIPFFLNLLGFYLIINEKKLLNYIAFFIYLLLPFFDFIHILFGLSILFIYFYINKKLNRFIPYSIIVLLTIYINNQFMQFGLEIIRRKLYEYFYLFGGIYGLSIFLVFLSFFGLLFLWKKKYKNIIYYLFLLFSLLILILNLKYLAYINLILCVLGSFGLRYVYKMRWKSTTIKNITAILLIGGILFSGISFLAENSKSDPNKDLYNSLIFLKDKTDPRDVILSHEKYGAYINTISKRKNFVDMNYAYAPRSELRYFYTDKIFYSRDLTNVLNIFKEFKVSYILITPEMKNGLVWNSNSRGLLYLLNRNPDYFNRIYNENGFEIWRVL